MKIEKKKLSPWKYKVKYPKDKSGGIVKQTANRTSFTEDAMAAAKKTPGAKYKVKEILRRIKGPIRYNAPKYHANGMRKSRMGPGVYNDVESFRQSQTPEPGRRWSKGGRKCKFDEQAKKKNWVPPPGTYDNEKVKKAYDSFLSRPTTSKTRT